MHRARLTAPVLLLALSATAGADEPKVTLLAGFEKAQLADWGLKTEGDTIPFLRSAVCRKGDATQGQFALVRTLTPRNVAWGGLKGETEEWLRYFHGTVLNATGRFRSGRGRPGWFPVDWSGHERLRLDVKTTKAALRLRVMLEDELVSPPTTRVFAVKPGGWVTLEIDLAEAGTLRDLEPPAKTAGPARVKVRTLNTARMANLMLVVEQADAATDVLVDNIRLLADASAEKARYAIVTDTTPYPGVFCLAPSTPRPRDVSGVRRPGVPVGKLAPILIDCSRAQAPSYHRLSEMLRHGITAVDEKRMVLAAGNRYTLDGGKTWISLGRLKHSANAPGDGIAAAGPDILAVYTGRCACGNSPSCIYFRAVTFDGTRWTMGQPSLVDVDSRHCPEFRVEVLRLASGRIWAAWFQDGRFRTIHLKARYSDDGGRLWRDPDSNAVAYFQRPTHWKTPLPIGVTLWPESPGDAPPLERANGRIGRVHPHTNLALVPYGEHVACIWGASNETLVWSHFDGRSWSTPALVVKRYGGPSSATTVGERTLYVAFRGKVYRLGAEAWTEDSPPRTGAQKLIAAGDVVHCVGKSVTIEGDQQVTTIWHSRKASGQAWSVVSVLAEERIPKSRFGTVAIIAPQEAFANVIPIAYGPHARWVRILRIPVGR